MRALIASFVLLAGCAAAPEGPREYLDEQTAATITTVAQPWIFTRATEALVGESRDFLHVYAVDVNRMGTHTQYLAVLQSIAPRAHVRGGSSVLPQLILRGPGELEGGAIELRALDRDPRELGLANPLAESYTLTSKWWYFPIDKGTLQSLARSGLAEAAMTFETERLAYTVWRDGREDVARLTAVLQ